MRLTPILPVRPNLTVLGDAEDLPGRRRLPDRGRTQRGGGAARKRWSPSWPRLIAKVYEVDPLRCTRCGQRMTIVATPLSDAFAVGRILDHLGLSRPEADNPPLREILRVAEHGEGWGVPAE